MKIKAVLFDLGDTLVKTWIPEAFQSVLASLGVDRSIEEIQEALAKTDKDLEESNYRSRYGEDTYRILGKMGLSGSHISGNLWN